MKLILFLIVLLSQACTQSTDSTQTTELEGTWSSACVATSLGFSSQAGSNTIVTTYNGNSINTVVNNFTDLNCSQLESTIEASQSTLFVNPGDVQVSFSIGNQVTSANGVTVKEIDLITVSSTKQLNIYLLQDNGNTLYFGLPCLINQSGCVNDRPATINYVSPYTKIN